MAASEFLDLYERRFDSFRFGAAEAQGFEVRSVRVQVEGLCPRCRTSECPRTLRDLLG